MVGRTCNDSTSYILCIFSCLRRAFRTLPWSVLGSNVKTISTISLNSLVLISSVFCLMARSNIMVNLYISC
ncbi:hypothetical protein ES332_D11G355100v1 [Gossypium tomentosum]|uniref:Uncharacterized protein n=1 Tax=Gossypium tomentosum TaxID=34277 RepID=A0A5D2IWE5_GOSTO|nr:hypothetical protein ES332_D11G355100v1 [Gossypium tomentosum]